MCVCVCICVCVCGGGGRGLSRPSSTPYIKNEDTNPNVDCPRFTQEYKMVVNLIGIHMTPDLCVLVCIFLLLKVLDW